MEEKSSPISPTTPAKPKVGRYETIIEVSTWLIMIAVIFGIQLIPNHQVDTVKAYLLVGIIIAFALIYYLIVYKYFPRTKRLYIKDIADIVFIGILIVILKDWGQYFYALFFLPIAAAALSLELINALLIALIASLFVVFEIFLGSQGLYPETSSQVYQGIWQIGLMLIITIFCRLLAIQVRHERLAKEEAIEREKLLKEAAARQIEFLALTSHQLLTPLSMIRGFASNLQFEKLGKLTPSQNDAAKEIYLNSRRMTDLVTDLLSISHIKEGKIPLNIQKNDLRGIITNIVKQFNETMPKKEVKIIYQNSEIEPFDFDKEKIRQVIIMLVDNALKYTTRGEIKITATQDAANTTVTIQDQGIGIDQADFDKLFRPFFRGKNILELDNKGTGLGLYIARLLIEKHHGKIWAKSPGQNLGATFTFTIPLIQSQGKENYEDSNH